MAEASEVCCLCGKVTDSKTRRLLSSNRNVIPCLASLLKESNPSFLILNIEKLLNNWSYICRSCLVSLTFFIKKKTELNEKVKMSPVVKVNVESMPTHTCTRIQTVKRTLFSKSNNQSPAVAVRNH